MPLIGSGRPTAADLAAWARWERFDVALAADPRLEVLARGAREAIVDFAAAGPCYAGVSWGKDSTLIAFLVATCGVDVPLVWARARRFENPDCVPVRDAFLAAFPSVAYEERLFEWTVPKRGEAGWRADQRRQDAYGETLGERVTPGGRYISGVRAAESAKRRMSASVHGVATARVCRPLLRWSHRDVFAGLCRWGLPVHPAYAQCYGGVLDRGLIRVHSLRTEVGNEVWERAYYPEVWAL